MYCMERYVGEQFEMGRGGGWGILFCLSIGGMSEYLVRWGRSQLRIVVHHWV